MEPWLPVGTIDPLLKIWSLGQVVVVETRVSIGFAVLVDLNRSWRSGLRPRNFDFPLRPLAELGLAK